MRQMILAFFTLAALQSNASVMYEQAFPDLNKDGLRDKVELTQENDGSFFVKFYLAKERYKYELISTGKFMVGLEDLGSTGSKGHLSITDKKEIVIEQMVGSSDRTNFTHVFEFRKNDLYLVKKVDQTLYFGNGTEIVTDYKLGKETTQQIRKSKNSGSAKITRVFKAGFKSLGEVDNQFSEFEEVLF